MDLPATVAGFTVIPVSYSSASTHYLYARPHSGPKKTQRSTLPQGRTLFLVNLPPDATEREITLFFRSCGTVETIKFDFDGGDDHDGQDSQDEDETDDTMDAVDATDAQPRKRRKITKNDSTKPILIPLPASKIRTLRKTGRSAHVVFLDASSLERALAASKRIRPWPTSPDEPSGLSHYMALYDSLRPPLDAVREHADSAIEVFEYELSLTKQKSKYRKGEAIVDEDGFTLVTRGGAYGQTLGGGVGVATKKFQAGSQGKRPRKKGDKEKAGFYAFQKAEKQRKGMDSSRLIQTPN